MYTPLPYLNNYKTSLRYISSSLEIVFWVYLSIYVMIHVGKQKTLDFNRYFNHHVRSHCSSWTETSDFLSCNYRCIQSLEYLFCFVFQNSGFNVSLREGLCGTWDFSFHRLNRYCKRLGEMWLCTELCKIQQSSSY